ncbi:MAG: V-type ATPase subunit [Bacillota bacterium]|nr:V-type ATPase subunit [Bacillota bacterium]
MTSWAGCPQGGPGGPEGDAGGPQTAGRDGFEYAFFVARIRVLETRLLTRNHLLRMVDAPDAETAFRMLGETEYGPAVAAAGTAADYEIALAAELGRVFGIIRAASPEPELPELLGVAYDWQNLKTALKASLTGRPIDGRFLIAAGNLDRALFFAVASGADGSLPSPYRETAARARAVYAASHDPQQVDVVVDGARFAAIIEIARSTGFELIGTLAAASADLINLRTVMRIRLLRASPDLLRQALLPGGTIPAARVASMVTGELDEIAGAASSLPYREVVSGGVNGFRQSGSLALLEKLIDDYLMGLVRDARYVALGPEPVIAYLMAKEAEIKNLRIIFTGKLNRLPEGTIRERLRETYA